MSSDRTTGQRFSQVYLDPGAPAADSARMRHRLAYFLSSNAGGFDGAAGLIQAELGRDVLVGHAGVRWKEYWSSAEPRDVLDTITLCWRAARSNRQYYPTLADDWLTFVGRVLREEHLQFEVDERGGVHYTADREFSAARAAAISGLGLPRYAAALAQFESGYAALDGAEQDTVRAVRGIFDALETVFKLMYPRTSRLGSSELNSKLKPTLSSVYNGNDLNAANLLLTSLGSWVNSAHHYRHSVGAELPAPPPVTLAIAMMGSGTAFLRWLIELDRASKA